MSGPTSNDDALHEWVCPNCEATTRARMADHSPSELDRLRAAAIAALTALRAERDAPTLTRSVVTEHNLATLAELVGVEWRMPS